jgi:hypothetical protein
MTAPPHVFGLMAEYETAGAVLEAARRARQAGYRDMDAYAPYPVEGLALALGEKKTAIPFVVLIGGLVGAAVGFFMQHWSMAVDYRLNVGGRPHNSWPVFIPVAFEMLILIASFAAFLSMLFLNGLPRPHHPLFNVPEFARASQDRFFLCVEATDPKFDPVETAAFLSSTGACGEIISVPFEEEPAVTEKTTAPQEPVAV